jgi:superfamily II DNA or RNA helicase/HKD family nuclease
VPPLPPGLYQTLVTELLASRLEQLSDALTAERIPLHVAEAADRIALYVNGLVQRALAATDDTQRLQVGMKLAHAILDEILTHTHAASLVDQRLLSPGTVLSAILQRNPDGTPQRFAEPLIPLLDTALLTNAPGEPRVGHQLVSECDSADGIDLIMAFIRRTGIAPLLAPLAKHTAAGRPLRILTTTYTGTTEGAALAALSELGADVRVSYDQTGTRLHAKAWLFHRDSGFSTAYLGSSNLTHAAQVTGLEWNLRLSAARNAPVIEKMAAVFESYWHSGDFLPFDAAEFEARSGQAASSDRDAIPIRLYALPFQEHLLERIELARSQGHHRNLLVSATGTGKTVMAALDYARLQPRLPRARLLFVAHRRELLLQARATYRVALRDPGFGELWVDGERPARFEHVFASIQSLSRSGYAHLDPQHFDVVVIDEFHHAAAASYEALLRHIAPRELLGMTATPERSDGLPILHWFDGRIAAELRLWDAIDQHRLTPFAYFGIFDGTDLAEIPWRRGRGYDVERLSALYMESTTWVDGVIAQLRRRAPRLAELRALGFCVSVEHARFMAGAFADAGIGARAIWAETTSNERDEALRALARGDVKVIFAVDLFNEGVDVPTINTLLMLRPTDSPVLFQQQLGRGLRKADGKPLCTVLDFVGHHHREFRLDRRLAGVLGGTRRDIERQVMAGFPYLPAGCHMELDAVAQEIVLTNLKHAAPSRWPERVEELRRLQQALQREPTLAEYLEASGSTLEELYSGNRGWSDLRQGADFTTLPAGPDEADLRRACGRFLHVDDPVRIDGYRDLLQQIQAGGELPNDPRDRRLARMLLASLLDQVLARGENLEGAAVRLAAHPQVIAELSELLEVLRGNVEHLTSNLSSHPTVPLQVHARYTRVELLAAFGDGDPSITKVTPWQSGVKWLPEPKVDLFAITMDKTDGAFSPTTRYRDYAINRSLIHWESQSVTRADSPTGLRYQHHAREGSHVMLFARHHSGERAYHFLGPASYVQHRGERPMAITWRLQHPLPADLFTSLAAAVA